MDIEPATITVNNEHAFVQALMLHQNAPVILLDDTDQLATRKTCINIAKGAFGPSHEVVWNAANVHIRFPIKGRLIWISNLDYTNSRHGDLETHWQALISRGIRPIWIDTSDELDAFRYIIETATTMVAARGRSDALNKKDAEGVLRILIDNRNYWKELSPRTVARVIEVCSKTRNDADTRHRLLTEEITGKPIRSLPSLPYPTIVGRGVWTIAPLAIADHSQEQAGAG